MTFFIYSRKSVYTGRGDSIENQVEMCRQYIRSKYPETADTDIVIYEDEGFSAKNTDRPQFQQMLRDIRLNSPDFVVCYRLDRISRNVSDFSSLIEELGDRSVSFVCIKEEFDTSKPMGKAMMYIASVFAQLERETLAERVRDNMLMLARTGRWLGGTPPTGYTSEKQQEIILDGKVKTSCRLKDNPAEQHAVDLMFEKFLELGSISGVSKYLIGQGIRSRSGRWYSLPGIKEILQNPVYCIADKDAFAYFTAQNADVCFDKKDCSDKYGLLAYNKRDYKKKHAPRQAMDKWIIAIGRHKGRVSGKKWAAVQKRIADGIPTGKKPAKMHNDYSLLSGLIYCDKCGCRMFAKQRSGKGAAQGQFDYVCASKLRGGTKLCSCQNIGGRQADSMVCAYLAAYMDESASIYKLLQKLKRSLEGQTPENPADSMEAQRKKYTDEMDRLVLALSQEALSPAFIQRVNMRVTVLDKQLSALIEEQERLQKEAPFAEQEIEAELLAGTLADLKISFDMLSIHEKRTLIKLLVKKIVWDEEDLHIFLDGA